jgi:hypothetical protein
MTLIAHVVLDGVTPEQYDRVRELCGWLERSPDGGLAHLTWWEGTNCHSIGCWESEQAFAAFGETRLGPAMAGAGIDVEPQVTFHEAHELFVPQALVRTRTTAASVR